MDETDATGPAMWMLWYCFALGTIMGIAIGWSW